MINISKFEWEKKGLIYKPTNETSWWVTHAMAPTPVLIDKDTIRIFMGCWDSNKISRISYIDVDSENPSIVKKINKEIVVDIGTDGCFDDNGVFPGHVYKMSDGRIFLYYTGFQKLDKIAFSNFSGLVVSEDGGNTFSRVSKAPVLDRADEGLFTRAGLSILEDQGKIKAVYAVGSSWYNIAGKDRPVYDVNYQETIDGIHFSAKGEKIVKVDLSVEHGLGRPQIVKILDTLFVFYTRRTLDFRYFIGCSYYNNKKWIRCDSWLNTIPFGKEGEFDNKMIYFPSVIDTGKKVFLFYTGNHYGEDGFGYAELMERC